MNAGDFRHSCKITTFLQCGVTTDGTPVMTGERNGVASLAYNKVREPGGGTMKLHCIIHQEAPCTTATQLGDVMSTLENTINLI